jgi:hypothetical protein
VALSEEDEMDDGQPIVVLTSGVEDDLVVIGVFGPYESEVEASEHVGFFRNPEMLERLRPGLVNVSISQHPLEDPSAFAERVGELLTDGESPDTWLGQARSRMSPEARVVDQPELNPQQQAAVRQMMRAIVERDEPTVAGMLRRECGENVYASPASDFWMLANNYADERLNLVMPPGDVPEWGLWGFPLRDRSEVLALYVDVWADRGRTDLTIQFDLVPARDGYQVELHDMHVM